MNFRSTPPPIKDFARLSMPQLTCMDIGNGLSLNYVDCGKSGANNISIMWNYGSDRIKGAKDAVFATRLMMEGTKSMTANQIADRLDFLGTFVNQNSGTSYSNIDALSLNNFTPKVLEILKDVLLYPTFPEERLEALKRKAISQYDIDHSKTNFVAREELQTMLCGPDHPYYRKSLREDIENITVDDVRRTWREGIFGTKMDVYASGNITEQINEALCEFAHAIEDKTKETPKTAEPVKIPFSPEIPGTKVIDMPGVRQSSIAIGIPTITRNHPDYIPLRIAVVALGGYFGSRLMTNIREEKGLTYGIHASLAGTYEGANINIYADCDAAYVSTVLKEINFEMERMAEETMDISEFKRLRSYYMTVIASTLESFKSIGDFYQSRLTVGIPDNYFTAQQDVLESITPEDISKIARRYFLTQEERIVICGTNNH